MVPIAPELKDPALNIENFSSYQKLVRVTALIFRFIYKTRKLNTDPNESAKLYLLKRMQDESFSKEITFLTENPNSKEIPSLVNQLNLFLDDSGILRSRGRLSKSVLYNYDVLNPIMLGKDHYLTKLIIQDFHLKCSHLGLQTTINVLRNHGFWITCARQSVKKVISKCITCQKFNNFAFSYPKMTNITKDRMNLVKPFQHTGVDFTSHIFVKDPTTNKCVKMYILIYTCLNIRAIHLDLLPDMSAQSFLLSFQRFSNIHGICSHLYSDNAKSFTLGGKILEKSLASDLFQEHMRVNNIRHIQIPLYSAWVGSTWERMIRVVKSCLYKTVGRAKLTYFELLTSLSCIQNVINARPLTYRSSEVDLDVISPNSFLKLHGNSNLILRGSLDNDYLWDTDSPTHNDLNRTLDIQEETFDKFKQLWYDSYLLSLREHSRNLYQSDWTNRIKVNDVVLVKMLNRSRPFWLLGRVLEVVIGFDDKIRSVKLKRGDGIIAHHSICHLYPLELSITHAVNGNNDNNPAESDSGADCLDVNSDEATRTTDPIPCNVASPVSRVQRIAAKNCRRRIRENLDIEDNE